MIDGRRSGIERQALGHRRAGGAQRVNDRRAGGGIAGGIGHLGGQRVAAVAERDVAAPAAVDLDDGAADGRRTVKDGDGGLPASATSTVPVTESRLVGRPPELVIATVGATVSTVRLVVVVAELPAASVATAVTTSAPWPARRYRRGPVPGTVHRHRRAVHRQGRADLRRAADLDAAGRFRRVDQVVAAFDGGDRHRWRHGIEREAQRRRADVAECIGLARHDGVWPSASPVGVNDQAPWASAVAVAAIATAVDRKMHHRVGKAGARSAQRSR